MASHYMRKAIQAGWDEMSRDYQNQTDISVEDVHYGPLCPGESELQILGDVRGKRILDIACGGAQNAIALANMGAEVFAIDFSRNQIAHARRLIGENSMIPDAAESLSDSLSASIHDFLDSESESQMLPPFPSSSSPSISFKPDSSESLCSMVRESDCASSSKPEMEHTALAYTLPRLALEARVLIRA